MKLRLAEGYSDGFKVVFSVASAAGLYLKGSCGSLFQICPATLMIP
jgi:hypothetical protein